MLLSLAKTAGISLIKVARMSVPMCGSDNWEVERKDL